jgi:hypothetical protein
MIAHENTVESALLGGDRKIEEGARAELFGRSFVTEPEHLSGL